MKLDNEIVEIKGTYTNLDDSMTYLSNGVLQFGSCFMGARRTKMFEIIQLEFPTSLSKCENEKAKVSGILHLNSVDPFKMNYILEVTSIQ